MSETGWPASQTPTPDPGRRTSEPAALLPGTTSVTAPPAPAPKVAESPRHRVRQLLGRIGAQKPTTAAQLQPLLTALKGHQSKVDTALLERAYRTAELHHEGQTRKSGDAYITHPLAVATILAGLGAHESTLCAALLHDTVEDTGYSLDQLRADFGDEIAALVDGVTKLDKLVYGENAKAETIRKMLMATSRDPRVLVIKLADRLHNMRTIHFLRQDKQERIAKDTLQIYAPLAHRLGMNALKWELEDLSFSVMEPKIYHEIVKLVAARAPMREEYLRTVIDQVQADLAEAKIKAEVYGRPKHYYSIYQKMLVRGRDFYDIYDLVGLRILVEEKRDCYDVLGILHAHWRPIPGRFKDYIAMPKFNLYQSLHTSVLGPGGKAVEMQIRTHEMHKQAEYGVAAHWKYKDGQAAGDEINWINSILQWQRETEDSGEFLDTFTEEIAKDEVFVFSPTGDVIALPQGSTPVDFAYAIHTEIGHRCIGARANGRLVPLDSELAMGAVVDIITSKAANAGPSRDWLGFVKTPRARSKIRQHFTRERRDEAIEQGKEALVRQLRRNSIAQRLLSPEALAGLAQHFHVADANALFAAVGESQVSAQAVVSQLIASTGGGEAAAEASYSAGSPIRAAAARRQQGASGVVVAGDPDMFSKLAKCCMPVPGDPILGFVTRGDGVSVHRSDCTNAANLQRTPERLVEVSWAPTVDAAYLVAVQIEGIDRAGLLSDVTKVMSELKMSIVSVAAQATKDRVFTIRLSFETSDPRHLDNVVNALKRISGVYDVTRVKST